MTFPEFDKFQKALLEEVVKIRDTKGKEYASDVDRFANFKDNAKELGLDPLTVAMIFADKHVRSIKQAIKTKQYEGRAEPLRGRFIDAIVYFTLMAGMVEEIINTPQGKPQVVTSNIDNTKCIMCNRIFNPGEAVLPYSGIGYICSDYTTCITSKLLA